MFAECTTGCARSTHFSFYHVSCPSDVAVAMAVVVSDLDPETIRHDDPPRAVKYEVLLYDRGGGLLVGGF